MKLNSKLRNNKSCGIYNYRYSIKGKNFRNEDSNPIKKLRKNTGTLLKEVWSEKGLSPFVLFLCIRPLLDDGCSGQPKHVAVYNKRLIY